MGRRHPRSLPLSKSPWVPRPLSWSARGMFHPAQHFLETRAVTLVGFVFRRSCYGDRASVLWAARRPGQEDLRARRPPAPRAPGDRMEHLARRCPPSPGSCARPGQGPPFPAVSQRDTRRCHLLLGHTAHTSAGPLCTLARAGAARTPSRSAGRSDRSPLGSTPSFWVLSPRCGSAFPPRGGSPQAGQRRRGWAGGPWRWAGVCS